MRGRVLCSLLTLFSLVLVTLVLPPGGSQAAPPPPCEKIDVTDPPSDRQATGQSLPDDVTRFSQIELLTGCVAETETGLFFRMTTANPTSRPANEQVTRGYLFTVTVKNAGLQTFTLQYNLQPNTANPTVSGAPGLSFTFTAADRSVTAAVPKSSIGNRPGQPIFDLFFNSQGIFVTSTGQVLTATDRAPNTGVLFPSPAPETGYRVGTRAPPSLDSDRDGLPDRNEIPNGTDPDRADTDFDGLLDGPNREVPSGSSDAANFSASQILLVSDNGTTAVYAGEIPFGTNATSPDTDGDGLLDGGNITTPVGSNATVFFTRFNVTSFSDDGVSAVYLGEFPFGLSPVNIDTDADGLRDRQEATGSENQRYPNEAFYAALPGSTSGTITDTDGEGLSDFDETSGTFTMPDGSQRTFPPTNPNVPDTDQDGLTDYEEVTGEPPTDPTNADTDGDSYLDGDEVEAGSDPVDPNKTPQTGGDGEQPGANQEFSYLLLSAIATLIIGLLCVLGILVRWG